MRRLPAAEPPLHHPAPSNPLPVHKASVALIVIPNHRRTEGCNQQVSRRLGRREWAILHQPPQRSNVESGIAPSRYPRLQGDTRAGGVSQLVYAEAVADCQDRLTPFVNHSCGGTVPPQRTFDPTLGTAHVGHARRIYAVNVSEEQLEEFGRP